jgi:hypothetical protein
MSIQQLITTIDEADVKLAKASEERQKRQDHVNAATEQLDGAITAEALCAAESAALHRALAFVEDKAPATAEPAKLVVERSPREKCADSIRAWLKQSLDVQCFETAQANNAVESFNPRTVRSALGILTDAGELVLGDDGMYRRPSVVREQLHASLKATEPPADNVEDLPDFLDRRKGRGEAA